MKKTIILLFLLLFSFQSLPLVANSSFGLSEAVSGSKGALNVDKVNEGASAYLSDRVGVIIGAILSFVGVLFMILIIYAGFSWMTARGNEKQVETAKSLIFGALIGLIIVLAAYAITAFVGGIFSS